MNSRPDIRLKQPLRALNTFGVDANAAALLRVNSVDELRAVCADPQLAAMRRLVLGGGSNLLLLGDFDGLVLHMTNLGHAVTDEDAQHVFVTAQAGENWHGFVQWTLAQGLPGLENLSLIPGSVGASPIQNIGAYGSEVGSFVHSVRVFDFGSGEVRVLSNADCQFGYRDSLFKSHFGDQVVILDVTFALPKQWQPNLRYAELAAEFTLRGIDHPSAKDISEAVIAIRSRKLPDPAKIGNAGSFFKNPVVSSEQRDELLARFPGLISYPQADGRCKLAAGWLIDQCGWKGKSMGAAAVHDRQALVLVNRGGASGAEILALARAISDDVLAKYGVVLEPEPVLV
jgi:UDP-N-acetylmuramate dehydrogenase